MEPVSGDEQHTEPEEPSLDAVVRALLALAEQLLDEEDDE
jgi:hypothetical protein